MRSILLLLALICLSAGETTAPPKAFLGIAIDQAATAIGGKGVAILRVEPGSPAAVMGLAAGDRLTSLDGKPVATEADIAAIMGAKKPGDQVQIEAARAQGKDGLPQTLKLSGVLQEAPRSRVGNLSAQLSELQGRIAELNAKNTEPTLAEVLQKLQDIEKELPKAAEAFKKVYPNGEFRIAISVEITSDKTAKEPLEIEVGGKPVKPTPDAPKPEPIKP